ncbi:MAG: hypothetical protein AB8H80_04510 [Planctomycetota bacterium]
MVQRIRPTAFAAVSVSLLLPLAGCGGGGSVSNASPRISEVPLQATAGGTSFSLDLDDFVSDREGAVLSYSVQSGGGAFSGSTYSNMFDTIGSYPVAFSVSDGQKTEPGSFTVDVTSANFVPVSEDGQSLLLLDSATNALVRVTSTTVSPTVVDKVGARYIVYRVSNGGDRVYDTYVRRTVLLAEDVEGGAAFRAKTSDGRIVYTTGTSPNMTLWYYNPATEVARNVADGVTSTLTVLVDDDDIVFFEENVDGQSDVAYYDPAEDEVAAISVEPTEEQLLALQPNGGVVFSRIGASGETDLYSFRRGTGLVEIGADDSALASRNKTFAAVDSNGKVVFHALNGADEELFVWDPSTGQTTGIVTGISTAVFGQLGDGNELVYYVVVSGSERDVYFYDLDDGVGTAVRNAADISTVVALTGDDGTNWAIVRASGTPAEELAVSLVATPATETWNAGSAVDSGNVLVSGGDYVAVRADGAALNIFDVSAGTWGTPITGTNLRFGGGGLDANDFVYAVELTGQDDLLQWDSSAVISVAVDAEIGDAAYAGRTLNDTVLFTRVVAGNTTADLFVWDGDTSTRLTDADSSGQFHAYATAGEPFAVTKF